MPEEMEFETYLAALKDDIENLEVVVSHSQDSEKLIIEIKSDSDILNITRTR